MIRDASPAETLALKTATEVLHMAGRKRVIMLGWPGPHSEGLVLSADDTADGSDCLVAIETFMKLAASMARQNGGTQVDASRTLWILMGTAAQKLRLSTDDLKKGFDLAVKDLKDIIRNNKK